MPKAIEVGIQLGSDLLAATRLASWSYGFIERLNLEVRFVDRVPEGKGWVVRLPNAGDVWVLGEGGNYIVEDRGGQANRVVLRLVLARELATRGGLVLHASGVCSGGSAWLFLGRSGTGKTTISMQADGSLLSDDTVIVLPSEGRFVAFGTPFTSEGGRPGDPVSAPLGALSVLAWSKNLAVQDIKRKDLVRALYRSVFLPPQHEALLAMVSDSVMKLADTVPGYLLSFPQEYRFQPSHLEEGQLAHGDFSVDRAR